MKNEKKEVQAGIESIKAEIESQVTTKAVYENNLNKLIPKLKEIEEESYEDAIAELRESSSAYSSKIAALEAENKVLFLNHSKLKQAYEYTDILGGDLCESCGAKVAKSNKERINTQRLEEMKELHLKMKENKDKIDTTQELLSEVKDKIAELRVKSSELSEKRLEITRKISNEENNIKLTNKDINSLRKELEEANNFESSYQKNLEDFTNLLEETEAKLRKQNKEHLKLTEQCLELEDLYEIYKFWEIGFSNKGIKSCLYDALIPSLNKHISKYLNTLNQGSIQVFINTQKKIGSGEKRDKFSVELSSDGLAKSYGACSIGQKCRINTAFTFALNRVTQELSKKKLNLLILDEIESGLDKEGIGRTVTIIRKLAKKIPSIFVMTHDESFKEYVNDEIKIIMEDKESYVE
jgi:DNA repair exonuclease SbcCD ATPase subunit